MEGLERMFASRAKKHGLNPESMSFGFSCDPPEPGKGIKPRYDSLAQEKIKIINIFEKRRLWRTLIYTLQKNLEEIF